MQDFWRLTSVLIALAGFAVTGGWLFMRGESIPLTIVKAVLAFAALYMVQGYLGGILMSATGATPVTHSKPAAKPKAEPKAEPKPAEEKK